MQKFQTIKKSVIFVLRKHYVKEIVMGKQELYSEYEKILLGKKHNYPSSFFNGTPKNSEDNACEIMRYAFRLLRWTPQDVFHHLNKDVMRLMKLDVLLKYINYPEELNNKEDLYYIAHILYPKQIPYNIQELTLNVYKKVLNREIYTFPKKYLQGELGTVRLKICFVYMIREYFAFHTIGEIYDFFASNKGTKALLQYGLLNVSNTLFETPIDLLHESLSESQKNDFYYQYYKFKILYKKEYKNFTKEAK